MVRIFEVMSNSVNEDGVCAWGKYLWEPFGQRNPENDPAIRRNIGSCLPNNTA
jgi:hypothetical protein